VTSVVVQPESKVGGRCSRAETLGRAARDPGRDGRLFPPVRARRPGCSIGRVSRWYPRFTLAPGGARRRRARWSPPGAGKATDRPVSL